MRIAKSKLLGRPPTLRSFDSLEGCDARTGGEGRQEEMKLPSYLTSTIPIFCLGNRQSLLRQLRHCPGSPWLRPRSISQRQEPPERQSAWKRSGRAGDDERKV